MILSSRWRSRHHHEPFSREFVRETTRADRHPRCARCGYGIVKSEQTSLDSDGTGSSDAHPHFRRSVAEAREAGSIVLRCYSSGMVDDSIRNQVNAVSIPAA